MTILPATSEYRGFKRVRQVYNCPFLEWLKRGVSIDEDVDGFKDFVKWQAGTGAQNQPITNAKSDGEEGGKGKNVVHR